MTRVAARECWRSGDRVRNETGARSASRRGAERVRGGRPPREGRGGGSEMVRYGVQCDVRFFDLMFDGCSRPVDVGVAASERTCAVAAPLRCRLAARDFYDWGIKIRVRA